MFMSKDDAFSEDELDDVGDDLVVPVVSVPTPQVLSGPYAGQQQNANNGDTEYRSAAYNERLARARGSRLSRPGQGSGMFMTNSDRAPRPGTASSKPASIDVLSQEVEEMELQASREQAAAAPVPYAQQYESKPQSLAQAPRGGPTRAGPTRAAPMRKPPADDDEELEIMPSSHAEQAVSMSERSGISEGLQQAYDAPVAPGYVEPPPPQQQQQPAESAGAGAVVPVPRPVPQPAVIDTSDLRAFLLRPGPQGAMVQCYIQRRKSGLARLFPTYEIYLKDGDQFLLAARKRKKKKSSNYVITQDRDDLGRHTNSFFGKLRANFIGTEFTLYDKGVNPEKLDKSQLDGSQVQVRQELGTILYKQNVLGSRGPRKMKVMVPTVNEAGQRKVLRPTSKDESMLERYKAAKNDGDVQILKNKQPKWNDQVGAYVLNFNGRVTRASVKNFQLCNMARDPDTVLMQFGRVGKDAFTMDFQWPLCALQAFGIALSSFDYKIACE
mmetsp:Transcript_8789/g.14855  ORF Transcript_8789/g.14855 Transcript_8789/m.14855 type:complete len:497 (+) Transcript_8789:72-1562(+)|eukprot:CAMPEP_0206156502 /NCGR_PEP_ID=MMETSP1474-20131121/3035_1 /ASSEMBLY_ACC=CAM_ASM_001110 /TAXON_ID=97495 /ORGANISM="Imantonia sp., Strain RCC918" /LENGTH=496 /DNA_ID=CAMNT_0053555611 /DNA_START=62 /DNA_END=1552 /DNA_ORIENTATION=-